MTKFLNISTDNTLGGNSPSDETVSSQKAIKEYVDNHGGSVSADGVTINTNSSDELQAIGLINKNPASGATNPKYDWVGTLQEYETQSVATAHPDWICYITDDAVTSSNGRCIGEIVTSTIPLEDAGLHLLDGSLIANGAYAGFVEYIAGLVSNYPDLFTTEANWQSSVTTYGACDKFVYDSINNTVRLPKRVTDHGVLIKSYSSGTDWYRIYSDGWCEQGGRVDGNATDWDATITYIKPFANTDYTIKCQAGRNDGSGSKINNQAFIHSYTTTGAVADLYGDGNSRHCWWQASGYIDISDLQQTPVYEYIVVSTSTKTDIEVDIDEVMTDLNGKVDKADLTACHVVVETYVNGSSWYRVYSDGWVEQGGAFTWSDNGQKGPINLIRPFTTTNYFVVCQTLGTGADGSDTKNIHTRNTTNFYITAYDSYRSLIWYACGY